MLVSYSFKHSLSFLLLLVDYNRNFRQLREIFLHIYGVIFRNIKTLILTLVFKMFIKMSITFQIKTTDVYVNHQIKFRTPPFDHILSSPIAIFFKLGENIPLGALEALKEQKKA